MNKTMRRKVSAFMRAAGQATETVSDAFGRQISLYAGVPIGVIEDDKDGNLILPLMNLTIIAVSRMLPPVYMRCVLA